MPGLRPPCSQEANRQWKSEQKLKFCFDVNLLVDWQIDWPISIGKGYQGHADNSPTRSIGTSTTAIRPGGWSAPGSTVTVTRVNGHRDPGQRPPWPGSMATVIRVNGHHDLGQLQSIPRSTVIATQVNNHQDLGQRPSWPGSTAIMTQVNSHHDPGQWPSWPGSTDIVTRVNGHHDPGQRPPWPGSNTIMA